MKIKISNSEAGSFRKGFIPFIRHQASEIHEGGWPVLLRKARTFLMPLYRLLLSLLLLPFWPVVLIVRALRPFILIRFGPLRSKDIGHFAGNTELYLCRRDAGMDHQHAFDIFYHQQPVCNQQLKIMWERILHVSRLARPVDIVNRALPGGKKHVIPEPPRADFDIHGLLLRTPLHLSFTPEEERLGLEGLQAMGIPEGAPFVCFHARDSSYHDTTAPKRNWRHTDHRDSSIHNHVPAAEEMTRRGYFAVRMGAVVKEPLQTTNPMIIDYATKYHSDFMDIYLCARCYFYIGDQSGLDSVAVIFRKPVANVNLSQFQRAKTWNPDNLFITKKLWLREEHRFLTFREIFDWHLDDVQLASQYQQLAIEPVENTPEEIKALAMEMDERLKGTWQTTEEDKELQKRFWSIYKPNKLFHGKILAHIGAEFLRQNRELLNES